MTDEITSSILHDGSETRASFKYISTDGKGLLVEEPYLAMSIDGSDYFPVSAIIDVVKKIKNG